MKIRFPLSLFLVSFLILIPALEARDDGSSQLETRAREGVEGQEQPSPRGLNLFGPAVFSALVNVLESPFVFHASYRQIKDLSMKRGSIQKMGASVRFVFGSFRAVAHLLNTYSYVEVLSRDGAWPAWSRGAMFFDDEQCDARPWDRFHLMNRFLGASAFAGALKSLISQRIFSSVHESPGTSTGKVLLNLADLRHILFWEWFFPLVRKT